MSTENEISIGQYAQNNIVIAGDHNTVVQYIAKQLTRYPYKFLSSYDLADRDIFFGRDAVIEELVGKIPRHKVLLINGASGAGKSSLLNAGVIPRWTEQGYRFLTIRDYTDPLQQLRTEFLRQQWLAESETGSLTQMLRTLQLQSVTLFVFDQFEQFFLHVPYATRQAFLQEFKACLGSLSVVEMKVIFAIRRDFLGQMLAEFEQVMPTIFAQETKRLDLYPLSREEAREAIINPLKNLTVKIGYDKSFVEEILLTRLLAQTSDQVGIEPPHLQIVCNQLYETAHRRLSAEVDMVQINAALYEELGGVEQILQTYLDDVVKEITADKPAKIAVIRSLLKAMIETSGTRRFVSVADVQRALPDVDRVDIERFLGQLQDRRVLETRQREEMRQFSLSHEIMVAQVASWFDEREWERKRAEETLERGLKEWASSGTLLNEKQFSQIRQWLPQVDATAEKLLVESERSNRAKRRNMRLLRASLVTFVVLAIGFGILSYFNAQEAERQKSVAEQEAIKATYQAKVAKLRQLGSQALLALQAPSFMNGYYDRTLLLAGQAFKEQSNLDTRETLLRVVNTFDKDHPKIIAYLNGHKSSVNSIAISPDGTTLASCGDDNSIILWDVKTRQPLGLPLLGHSERITKVAFSADLNGHKSSVNSIAISPDGTTLASCGDDNSIILWDVKTRQPLGLPLLGHSERITKVAFSADGKTLASGSAGPFGSGDNSIILWDVTTHQNLGSPLRGHTDLIWSIAFSVDGKILASGSFDQSIILWDVTTHQPIGSPLEGEGGRITSLAFSPDGKILASGTDDRGNSDNEIILWDVATHQPLGSPLLGHSNAEVTSVAFSPDGKILASSSWYNGIILWDVTTHRPIGSPLEGGGGRVTSLAFSPDGKILASGNDDRDNSGIDIILWDVTAHQPLSLPLLGHRDSVNSVAFSSDGKTLASVSRDNSIILWDVTMQKPIGSLLLDHSEPIDVVAFTPDGTTLASSSYDKTVILWDVKTRQPLGSPLLGHSERITKIAFSADGKTLASGSEDNSIILWDVKTQQPLGSSLRGHREMISGIAFSPNGKTLASSSYDKTVILWDAATHQPIGSPLQGYSDAIDSVAFSPDGKTLASVSWDNNAADGLNNSIILWDVSTHQSLGVPLQGHSRNITSVTFSPNGKTLASSSYDETVILWDIKTKQPLGSPLRHSSEVYSVAFSPDGKTLASGSRGTVMLWDVDPQSWYQKACRIAGRNLTYEEWQRYLPDEPYQKTCPQYPEGGGWEQVLFK